MYNRIDLPLTPSRIAGLFAATPWLLLALAALVAAGYGMAWVALATPVALAGALDRWRRCGTLAHPRAVIRLVAKGPQLFITLANQTTAEVRPLPQSRLSGQCLYLALQDVHYGHRTQVILVRKPDGNAPPEALRRLRTWLRLMPQASAPIDSAAWQTFPLQRPRPGGTPHDH
ncbi:hypothetical protein ACFOZ5_04675 [Marinobacter lacisalsi]|uniref:Toxin CptA n=1 Tax=Marinobacter lacisalsi TaxID=475979 RepID=A0ABV8QG01_9GAMM